MTKSFSSGKIVSEIKTQVKKNSSVFRKFLEENTTAVLDPGRDTEFLGKGWLKNTIYRDEVVKPVSDRFEFELDIRGAQEIIIRVAVAGSDAYLNGPVLSLKLGQKLLGKAKVRYSFFTELKFRLTGRSKSNGKFTGVVEFKNERRPIYIRLISAVKKNLNAEDNELILIELDSLKQTTDQLLQLLDLHKNPEWLLPADTRPHNLNKKIKRVIKRFVIWLIKPIEDSLYLKKTVLHAIRPFTTPQVAFNKYLLDVLQLQAKKIDLLESLVIMRENKTIKTQNDKNTPNS